MWLFVRIEGEQWTDILGRGCPCSRSLASRMSWSPRTVHLSFSLVQSGIRSLGRGVFEGYHFPRRDGMSSA